jgi:hemerythrin-like domain-containing protein
MNLHDPTATADDPLEMFFGFHRRIERQLAMLCRLPAHLEVHGVDAAATSAAASLLQFFTQALPLHHADEERDLLPMIELRMPERGDRSELRDLRQRLESDHRDMDATWRRLRRPLEGVAEGLHRGLPVDLAAYFRAIHSLHISTEECGLHALATRTLAASDHEVIARRMQARRTVMRASRI